MEVIGTKFSRDSSVLLRRNGTFEAQIGMVAVMEDVKKRVGQKIRDARKEKGLTQKGLAEKLGVGEPTVNGYEGGKQNLTIETLQRIADALSIKLSLLLERGLATW